MLRLPRPRTALAVGAALAAASSLAVTAGAQAQSVTATPTFATSTLTAPTLTAPALTAPALTGHRTFAVSPTGDDAGPGTTSRPWRTLARAARAGFRPGDTLLVRRGATYRGGLVLTSSGTAAAPISVLPVGPGAKPVIQGGDCIRLKGSHIRVYGVDVRRCSWSGVSLEGAHDNLSWSRVSGNVVGVHVTPGARDAVVRSNVLVDNRRLSPGKNGSNDDSGVNGVLVQGTRTTIANNRISGHHAPSPDYGTEGSAIEVYGARSTTIASNSSIDNSTFVELGERTTTATRILRNTVTSSIANGYFVVTRGAQDPDFGPVLGTVVEHNSVAMNGDRDGGLICFAGCSPRVLRASHNIIVSRDKPTWTDGSGMGGSGNILVNDSDPRSARRLFVDRTRDLRLVRSSPAVDAAGRCAARTISNRPDGALGSSSWLCRDGNGDGRAGTDVGALER